MSTPSVEAYLKHSLVRFAGAGLIATALISVGIAFGLARLKTAANLEDVARATVSAFHDQIVSGDARGAEVQIQTMLQLAPSESAWLLKADRSRVYQPVGLTLPTLQRCQVTGSTCVAGLFGPARILEPIYFGNDRERLFGYLSIEREVRMDWAYLITVFLVSVLGAGGIGLAMLNLTRRGATRLGVEVGAWSARLESDPKSASPLAAPPFAELLPLKDAIEGLHEKIEALEKEASHKAKLLLLRGIAHDVLTPVSQLQLRIATLGIKLRGTPYEPLLEHIRASLQQITGIASQVKLLKEELPPPDGTDLIAATQAEIELMRQADAILSKGIKLQVKACNGPLPTPFSRVEISRILGNLVGNAAHASKKGSSIVVEIGQENGLASLKVRDEGCGIPAAHRSKVFDPEFTLKPGTGTGLGLAVVKYLCEQRQATVALESVESMGTTVTIRVASFAV